MMLTSPALDAIAGIRHGFSMRVGTDSIARSDRGELLRETSLCMARFLGFDGPEHIRQIEQVHGTRVVVVGRDPEGEGDALVSIDANVGVAVRTADCAPVLIACTERSGRAIAVAAVHAGWRGAVAKIMRGAVEHLESLGANRACMTFAIGPTIGAEAYEVGDEVVWRARESLDGRAAPARAIADGKHLFDLAELLVRQLEGLGIDRRRVDRVGGCTYSDRARFFSYRRDGEAAGRHLSAIRLERGDG